MENHKANNKQVTILVAEDPDNSHLIRFILEREGYHVLPASNWKEAFSTFMDFQPDLILSGLSEEKINGDQLLEEVRATPKGNTIPFILIYSRWSKNNIPFAESMGAQYIHGPFNPEHLINLIQTCLKGSDDENMPNDNLRREWKTGDAVAVGRCIMEPLTAEEQVIRALKLLKVCLNCFRQIPELNSVIAVASDPSRWAEAHKVFSDIRRLTLKEERKRTNDIYYSLLYIAENTAKTVYNASGAPRPFDYDSPWWLAQNVRSLIEAVGDSRFEDRVWSVLMEEAT